MSSLLQSSWSDSRSWRRCFITFAPRATLPVAMLLAATLTVSLAGDRSASSETLFLALWATAVFAPLALLEAASRPVYAALALAATALICALPRPGGLRPVAVAGVLALAVVILAALTFARRPAPGRCASAALALAAAITLHGHRLFLDGLSVATVALLVLLPGAAAALAARLAAAGRPGAALAAALALLTVPQLASEPWWVGLFFAVAAVSASFGSGAGATLARRSLLLFGGVTLLAGGFPWLRAAPVATLLEAAAEVGRPVAEMPLRERTVVLTPASPRFAADLSGTPIRSVVIDSYLTHAVDLACGYELASIETVETMATAQNLQEPIPTQGPWRATLVIGRDSAEWAAGRRDVAARLACPAPAPWYSWIPTAGRFIGQTTRTRFALGASRTARSLVIERNPALPAETTLALFFVATER